jgi:hypothetical protein
VDLSAISLVYKRKNKFSDVGEVLGKGENVISCNIQAQDPANS